ncbi:MAG: hypothetical protein QM765_39865 [Myxococcales bacterium]
MDSESTPENPVEATIRERLAAGDLTEAAKLGLNAYGPGALAVRGGDAALAGRR